MAKKRPGKKVRVDFKQNRGVRQRSDDWTRQYNAQEDRLLDSAAGETIRAKGDLSRKRTIIVDDENAPLIDESLWKSGVITAIQGMICFVDTGDGPVWDCNVRRVLRTRLIAQRGAVAVGDRVWLSDQSSNWDGARVGVVERVEPRTAVLSRKDRRQREHTIVANADQLLIVASIAQPGLKPHLIDRYLVAAGWGKLRPVICFNKSDLVEGTLDFEDADADFEGLTVDDVIDEFRTLGYCCLKTSAVNGDGIDALRSELAGHTSVLSGQSGVGKSSLLNALEPGLGLRVQTVSIENEKGRHTTTHAQLFRLAGGGFVVDTPGIRQFALWGVTPGELEAYFTEFLPLIPRCKFRDCHHSDETGCAVIAAAEAGEISERRYYSYVKMLTEIRREGT
ncbi:MAG: ribosome small subunit-dependent GTPase A [Phycisphaerae bacterium]